MSTSSFFKGESLARLLQGTVVGAIAAVILGFNWGGWTLGSTAEKEASNRAESALVSALAPICMEQFQSSVDFAANRITFNNASQYQRVGYISEGGWATFVGDDSEVKGVAKVCAKMISDS